VSKGDLLEVSGVVVDALGGGQYRVDLDESPVTVRGRLSGRMRSHRIRVLPGDRVKVALSPYDLSHGFIVFRESGSRRRRAG
jgi:translation initiation factor IF-1